MRRLFLLVALVLTPSVAAAQWVNVPTLTIPIVMPSAASIGTATGTSLTLIGPGTGVTLSNNSSTTLGVSGPVTAGGFTLTSTSGSFSLASRGFFSATVADGLLQFTSNGFAIGNVMKVDFLPAASACGAGSPAVVAGSTALSGSVTVGTGGPATCTITFGGTAYPSAPHCSGAVETTTAANARAMGYSASTTVLTIVPTAAWADSSVVNWTCWSAK